MHHAITVRHGGSIGSPGGGAARQGCVAGHLETCCLTSRGGPCEQTEHTQRADGGKSGGRVEGRERRLMFWRGRADLFLLRTGAGTGHLFSSPAPGQAGQAVAAPLCQPSPALSCPALPPQRNQFAAGSGQHRAGRSGAPGYPWVRASTSASTRPAHSSTLSAAPRAVRNNDVRKCDGCKFQDVDKKNYFTKNLEKTNYRVYVLSFS